MNLILLFLLGIITYLIVQRVSSVTRTPTWLLWLVVMMPAFIWNGWALVKGNEKPPPELFIIPFIVCLMLYWFLIQWGRISTPPAVNSSASQEEGQTPRTPTESSGDATISRPINKAEENSLHHCFPWSVYYLQNIELRPQAVICRGQLRSKPEVAYQTIRDNIEDQFGDRFYVVFQEEADDKPVFVLVPNPQSRSAAKADPTRARPLEPVTRPVLALGLLGATFFTTAFAWAELADQPVRFNLEALMAGLPYAIALMTILGIHELGHYLTARRYRIQATLPYFIPVIPMSLFPFGTFGAFIQIRSPIPNRRALFDVGIAGPLWGFIVALPLLLWGLAHSDLVSMPAKPDMFNFQAFDPSFSILLALLSKLAMGSSLTATNAIRLHPVAVAGCLGMVVTAFNLMPVGQLDGGHIIHAMYGQRSGARIGQVARILLLLLSFAQPQLPYLMVWAVILFLLPATDEPALNDVTELDNRRDLWGILTMALLLLIILPVPNFLAQWLNI
jgi:membrane-associated protease RseP (regulator of RpoE activity)